MAATCKRVADSSRFQLFILGVILANAVVLGLETYDSIDRDYGGALEALNDVFLGIFVVEIVIRIAAHGSRPQDYFKSGWNVFDFVVIGGALLPGLRQNATVLRLLRLLRIVRVVSIFPDLRFLIRGMATSLPPIGSMAMLTSLLIYIYGILGWIFFADTEPEHWGDIGEAMLSLFIVLTLESWPEIMGAVIDVHPWAWIYFVSYVLIASFLLINMVIAILINSLEEVRAMEAIDERLNRRRDEREAEGEMDGQAAAERLARIREALDELEEELHLDGHIDTPKGKRDSPRMIRRFRG
ncbi:MAG TPA: ion transporter [Solirubrobacterales bacterium]|nr:ion transporter [Solirubrobacterales bacterium]